MKQLYFWCNIITPHWLHTLSALAQQIKVEVHIYADSLAQIEERRGFGWGTVGQFPRVSFYTKRPGLLDEVDQWPKGYHLVTNPFNDVFNKNLIKKFIETGISYGLQQSKPGLMSGLGGRVLRRVGYRTLFRGAMNSADYILCHGEMCRQYLARVGVRREKLFLSGYFVPAPAGLPPRSPRPAGEPLKAIFLGQFIERKAILPLAKMAREKLPGLPVRLDFAGAGQQLEELKALYRDGPGAVLPPVKYTEVIPFLRQYDILVLPSRADEWAVVVNEAIHAGCGVIVTDACGAADLVGNGGCGKVVSNARECIEVLVQAGRNPDLVVKWQSAAERLSPLITSAAGASYLARILLGLAHAHGPGCEPAPWEVLERRESLRLAMVYHFFAHYRLPIIRELKRRPDVMLECFGDVTSRRIDASIKPITLKELPDLNVTPVVACGQFLWQRHLVGRLINQRADAYIFLASPYFVSTWVTVLLLRLRRRKVLYWGHLRFGANDTWALRLLRELFYKMATGWLAYGHLGKAGLVANGVPERAIHVIYNSLDYGAHLRLRNVPSVTPPVQPFPEGDPVPTFICVSRLVYKRRLDLLFAAMADLKARGRKIRLLLVGDGEEREMLKQNVARLALDVCFFGACYDETLLRELYRGVVATVAPGEVGLTAIQSLSFGVPVITHGDMVSQMPEAESVVDGVTGWLFEKGDSAALGRALERALESDPVAMQAACFGMIDNFYNPAKQVQVITRASLGMPAVEIDWYLFLDKIKDERHN